MWSPPGQLHTLFLMSLDLDQVSRLEPMKDDTVVWGGVGGLVCVSVEAGLDSLECLD